MKAAAAGLRAAAADVLDRLPAPATRPVQLGYRVVKARRFQDIRQWRSFLVDSDHWPAERLRAYQLNRMQALLRHAAEHVPHYRHVLREAGFEPADLCSLNDVRRLPILEKATLQRDEERLVADNVPPRARSYVTTAGSTGIPVGFWVDAEQGGREIGFIEALWRRVDFRPSDRVAVLRGTVVPGGRLWALDLRSGQLIMSSYHLTADNIPLYLERLRRFRPRFLHVYPSSVLALARYMDAEGVAPMTGVHAVLCGSENLYDWQREAIERAFGCRAFSWYGQSENVCLAGECEQNRRLHVVPQYGLLELLDGSGDPISEPGVPGEIVGTGLHARAMPLIRYRTGDVAQYAEGRCACGREHALLERVEGRLHEFIVTATGRQISMAAINMHSRVFDQVEQFRFFQEEPGVVSLRVVPKPTFAWERDSEHIRRELSPKLGDDVTLRIEVVPEIPRSGRGKFRFLEQLLPVAGGDAS